MVLPTRLLVLTAAILVTLAAMLAGCEAAETANVMDLRSYQRVRQEGAPELKLHARTRNRMRKVKDLASQLSPRRRKKLQLEVLRDATAKRQSRRMRNRFKA